MALRLPHYHASSNFTQKRPMFKNTVIIIVMMMGCASQPKQEPVPPEQGWLVYHIQPDRALDDPFFTLCDVSKAYPYYGTDTHPRRDKGEITAHFVNNFIPSQEVRDSGFICIRFMVNCIGVAGRFRVIEFDKSYTPMKFDSRISSQLLKLTQNVKDWEPIRFNGGSYDSYCYFLFKIEDGKLTDVLP
jgi:hypothetical protein